MRKNGGSFYTSPWATSNTLQHAPGITTHDHTSHIAQHPNTCRIAVMLCIIPQLSITHFGNSVEPYGINSARAYQKKRHDVAFSHTFVQLSLHRDLVPDNPLSKNRYTRLVQVIQHVAISDDAPQHPWTRSCAVPPPTTGCLC